MSAESDLAGYTAAKSIMRYFANEMSKEATENYLKNQNKLVAGLTKDFKSPVKDDEKEKKDMENAKENIENPKK